jgi:protein involved in polysaccharide export with SLBB domain
VTVAITNLIGPGNTIELQRRVSDGGQIPLPYLGLVRVGGLSVPDANDELQDTIRRSNLTCFGPVPTKLVLAEPAERTTVKWGPVRAGDTVLVRMWDLVGPNEKSAESLHVAGDGTIAVSLIGTVKVAGLTDDQIEVRLIERYREAKLIQNLITSVLRTSEGEQRQPTTPPTTAPSI